MTRATHLIKGGSDHTVQYPLTMSTVHDHEGMQFISGEGGGELHSVNIGEGWQDSTWLLFSCIVRMRLCVCVWEGCGVGSVNS